jgi:hypothetical protein
VQVAMRATIVAAGIETSLVLPAIRSGGISDPRDFLKSFQGDLPCPALVGKIFRFPRHPNQF